MPRRAPARRVIDQRSSENVKRGLLQSPEQPTLEALAARIRYEAYAKHKQEPRAFGLEPLGDVSEDASFCDAHAGWRPEDMRRLPALMRRGVQAGLVSDQWRLGDPALIWSVDDDGWIYEARLTLATQALYHGYPMLPPDAMAPKVIARYAAWVYDTQRAELNISIHRAQERYSR